MSRIGDMGNKLYRGQVQYDFIARRRRWYAISGLVIILCGLSLAVKGLNFGVEFTGGTVFSVQSADGSVEQVRKTVSDAGIKGAVVQKVNNDSFRIQTEALSEAERNEVAAKLAKSLQVKEDIIGIQFVGPSWGSEITKKAVSGLLIFLVLVAIFLTIYFEFKMAIAALIALVHDVLLTIGVYSILGIEVTPATVIGVLTILGYSLYDTVVVFDKVRENTAGLVGNARMTYSQAANLAVNQTLVRSINTSVVALLPVLAILVGAVGLLGAGTLEELGVALFVGIAAGTYSSIFIATPILADLKEREPAMQSLARRVEQRQAGGTKSAKKASAATSTDEIVEATAAAGVSSTSPAKRQQPSKKNKGKRR
jgi:preprotein translocase subunit SecF